MTEEEEEEDESRAHPNLTDTSVHVIKTQSLQLKEDMFVSAFMLSGKYLTFWK